MTGQGSTEYVIILGLVLIIATISMLVMGFFSGFSESSEVLESQSYWQNAATPFALIDWKFASTPPKLFVMVQNRASSQLNLTSLNITTRAINFSVESGTPNILQPGGRAEVIYTASSNCDPNKVYEAEVTIRYATQSIANLTQNALKPLMLRCTS